MYIEAHVSNIYIEFYECSLPPLLRLVSGSYPPSFSAKKFDRFYLFSYSPEEKVNEI
jgi:hypothetical protein